MDLIINFENFNKVLLKTKSVRNRLIFIKKYILHGIPFIFDNRENEYFEFRNRIAEKFNVGFHEVFIVGSAKLGFSFFKNTLFSIDSDIDVVIVNEIIFEKFFKIICNFQYKLKNTFTTFSLDQEKQYSHFLQYFIRGWMRPDLLPTFFQVKALKKDWFDFFNSISYDKSEVGNYKVNAGLYKNYHYLETYHLNCVDQYYKKIKE